MPKFHPALRLSSFYRVMKNALMDSRGGGLLRIAKGFDGRRTPWSSSSCTSAMAHETRVRLPPDLTYADVSWLLTRPSVSHFHRACSRHAQCLRCGFRKF